MADQRLGAVGRGDGSDDLRSEAADRLTVAEVENDVHCREVNLQANDAAPAARRRVPSREAAEQLPIG
jgi:hypothetical protein